MNGDGVRLAANALRGLAAGIVERGGSSAAEADAVATNLVEANLTGHDSHGVGMLPQYVANLRAGGLHPNRTLRVVADQGTLLRLDGGLGYGQTIGRQAMALAIERARVHGVVVVGLANSHHLGRIGAWAEQCLDAGLVSVHFVNVISRPLVAPWGGLDARLVTNPVCIGVPLEGGEPVVLDFATSRLAMGKVRVAHHQGRPVPPGTLIDAAGQPCTDPGVMFGSPAGALLPFGEHKGHGLALVCELLGGALSGGQVMQGTPSPHSIVNHMTSFVVDPARMGTARHLADQARALADWVKASPASADGPVRLPGEPERDMRRQRLAEGIPIDAVSWGLLLGAGRSLGLDDGTMHRLAGC